MTVNHKQFQLRTFVEINFPKLLHHYPSSQEKQLLQNSCKTYISCKISEFESNVATLSHLLQKFWKSCVS